MIFEIALVMLAVLSIAAVQSRDLLHAVIVLAAADAVLAFAFLLLSAPDVAITQAAVGSGLTTFIFALAVLKTRREE